ncbi:MAG: multicopper oxidase domain-containing protein [Candidatus Binatia bacterium]
MSNKISRRQILGLGAATIAGISLSRRQAHATNQDGSGAAYKPFRGYNPPSGGLRPYWEKTYSGGPVDVQPLVPVLPGKGYKPVVVPNGAALPFKIVDDVKVFHLIAEEVDHAFDSGLRAKCWGYNGRVNSTVIEAVEGERVRIYVTNRLPAATSVHWHGFNLPNGMDGVGGLTQPYIKAGETVKYEFILRQYGTQMFHSHHDEMTQMGMGLIGNFIIHPRNPRPEYYVDRDFSLMISEWDIPAGTSRPNTLEMNDFNVLTINGKVFPSTAPLVCKTGDKVRIRFGNLGATDHHPMHLHGHHFRVTATDGEDIPLSAQWPETTVLVAVGQSRNVEFITDAPGDWPLHCHMTHHIMNQMGHEFPNMVGINPEGLEEKLRPLLPAYMTMGHTGMDMGRMAEVMPYPQNTIAMKGTPGPFGDYISMGGLFTILKVRDELKSYDEDPGWYKHPAGTVALKANDEELRRDGIDVRKLTVNAGSRPSSATKRNGHGKH